MSLEKVFPFVYTGNQDANIIRVASDASIVYGVSVEGALMLSQGLPENNHCSFFDLSQCL